MINNESPKRALFLLAICLLLGSIHFVEAVREPTNFVRGSYARVKGRRLSETIYAWRDFEDSFARKHDETFSEDDIKKCQKMASKYGVTCTPSAQPSSEPSAAPTTSMAPSLSSAPSLSPTRFPSSQPTISPSESPTDVPSVSPTNFPTGEPSVSPTSSPTAEPSTRPTIAPTTHSPTFEPFESLVLTRDDGSLWVDNSCRNSLPASATTPQSEATTFEYFLQITPGADASAKISEVEQSLSTALADEVLNTCSFGTSETFETYGITSLPIDVPSEDKECPENFQLPGADCYVITAGFTPTIFYMQDRRQLKVNRYFSSQVQSDIVAVFGPILQNLLDSDRFIGGDVLKTTYYGFTVKENAGNLPQISGDVIENNYGNGQTAVSIQGNPSSASNGDDDGTPAGFIGGAIAICLALIALIVVGAVLLQRRKDARLKREFELCEDEGGLDLDGGIEIDTHADPSKYDTRNIRDNGPESHPGDADNSRENPEDSSVIEARRAVSGLKYSVVNDEATFDQSMDVSEATEPHDYTTCKSTTCFKCRSKGQAKPIFVKADLTAIRNELGPNKEYRPKYPRNYKTHDTVDL